jgi:hypothetical protein
MRRAWAATWHVLRALTWLFWIAFIAYGAEYLFNREGHIDSFGHLLPSTELFMFGLPLAAVFIGLLTMLARERAGVVRTQPLMDH